MHSSAVSTLAERFEWSRFLSTILAVLLLVAAGQSAWCQTQQDSVVIERYKSILQRNPRLGTAFDRVYEFYSSRQNIPELLEEQSARFAASSDASTALLLGMIHARSGDYASAIESYRAATGIDTQNSTGFYYLSKALRQNNQSEEAVKALKDALQCKPTRQLRLELSIELANLLKQLRRGQEALETWEDLEAQFPNDNQVLQQVAFLLMQQGELAEARKRYESLAASTKDRFQAVEWSFRAAQIQQRLGQNQDALDAFEKLIRRINPGSWLHASIRDSIDDVFLTQRDYEGLIGYYRKWSQDYPEDIDSVIRCGRLLSIHGQSAEAKSQFALAIKRAPSLPEPRIALVDALERELQPGEAAKQMEELVALEPTNLDYIQRWGQLVFEDSSTDSTTRIERAAAIWKRMLVGREDDAAVTARVADMLRSGLLTDQAISLYRQAISLAEGDPQYREYLGEYLHSLGRQDEAISVWGEIASGSRATLDNFTRLSEIFSTFKFPDRALDAMAEACELKPTLRHRLRYSELLRGAEHYEAALAQVQISAKMAVELEELQPVFEEEILSLLALDTLNDELRVSEQAAAKEDTDADANAWLRIALMRQAADQGGSACEAIERAVQIEPNSVPLLTLAAELNEQFGNFGNTLAALNKLSSIDRASRSSYIQQISALQMRLGMIEEALVTASELVNSDSATSEQFRYYADLCAQAGKSEESLAILRRNVFANPNDLNAVLLLAESLRRDFKTAEATELAWRAFELAARNGVKGIDDQTLALDLLTELFLVSDGVDALIERIKIFGKERNWIRHSAILQSIVLENAGYYFEAREQLEPMLAQKPDVELATRLKRLALSDDDFDAAIAYQETINNLQPSAEGRSELSRLFFRVGDYGRMRELWKMDQTVQGEAEFSRLATQRAKSGDFKAAIDILADGMEQHPESWELLTLKMLVMAFSGDEGVSALAEKLLTMDLAAGTPSSTRQEQIAKIAASRSYSGATAGASSWARLQSYSKLQGLTSMMSALRLQGRPPQVQSAARTTIFSTPNMVASLSRFWPAIDTFSDARALAVLVQGRPVTIEKIRAAAKAKDVDSLWAWLATQNSSVQSRAVLTFRGAGTYVPGAQARQPTPLFDDIAQALADMGEQEAIVLLLQRKFALRQQELYGNNLATNNSISNSGITPLSELKLDDLLKLIDSIPDSEIQPLYLMWGIVECDVTGREPTSLLARMNRVDASAKDWLLTHSLAAMHPKRSAAVVERALRTSLDAGIDLSSLGANLEYHLAKVFFIPSVEAERPKIMSGLLDVLLKTQAEYVRRLRPSQLAYSGNATSRSLAQTRTGTQTRMFSQVYSRLIIFAGNMAHTGRVRQTQVDARLVSPLQPINLLQYLKRCYDYATLEEKELLLGQLSVAAEQQDDSQLKLCALLNLAAWQIWDAGNEEALELLTEANEMEIGGEHVKYQLSLLYERMGDLDTALHFLNELRPRNPKAAQNLEMAKLDLATRAGGSSDAEKAARKLFAMNLDTSAQLSLAKTMYRLGMEDMADSIMNRMRSRRSSKTSTQVELMEHFDSKKDTEAALAIAKAILRKTKPGGNAFSANTPVRFGSSNFSSRTSNSRNASPRSKALAYLKRKGQLPELISEAEQRYAKAPDSRRLIERLSELYSAAGRQADAMKLTLKQLEQNGAAQPAAVQATFQQLMSQGKAQAAIELASKHIEKTPNIFSSLMSPTWRRHIDSSRSWHLIAEEVIKNPALLNVGTVSPYLYQGLARERRDDLLLELLKVRLRTDGLRELQNVVFISPSPFSSNLGSSSSRSGNSAIKFDKEFAGIVSNCLKRIADNDTSIPYSYRAFVNGRYQGAMTAINQIFSSNPEVKNELMKELRDKPDSSRTSAHSLLLAFFEAAAGNTDEAIASLERVSADAGAIQRLGSDNIWEACEEIISSGKGHARVLPVVKQLADGTQRNVGQLQNSPAKLLLECYEKLNQFDAADKFLDQWIASTPASYGGGYGSNIGAVEFQQVRLQLEAAEAYWKIHQEEKALNAILKAFSVSSSIPSGSRFARSTESAISSAKRAFFTAGRIGRINELLTRSILSPDSSLLALANLESSRATNNRLLVKSPIAEFLRNERVSPQDALSELGDDLAGIGDKGLVLAFVLAATASNEKLMEKVASEYLVRARSVFDQKDASQSEGLAQMELALHFMSDKLYKREASTTKARELLQLALDCPAPKVPILPRISQTKKLFELLPESEDKKRETRARIHQLGEQLPRDAGRHRVAWELASMCIDAGLVDESIRMTGLAYAYGPPIARAAGNTLSTTSYSAVTISPQSGQISYQPNLALRPGNSRASNQVDRTSVEFKESTRISELSDAWKSQEADPELVTAALMKIVFPPERPSEIYMYIRGESSPRNLLALDELHQDQLSKLKRYSAAADLLWWANQAGKLEAVVEEAKLRSKNAKDSFTVNKAKALLCAAYCFSSDITTATTKLKALLEPDNLGVRDLGATIQLVFCGADDEIVDSFDLDFFRKVSGDVLRLSVPAQRVLAVKLRRTIASGDLKATEEIVELLEDVYAVRASSRRPRLYMVYDSVSKIATSLEQQEIADLYIARKEQLNPN